MLKRTESRKGKNTMFGVVILNYESYDDTINCIRTFKLAEEEGYSVQYVIVDNGSANESVTVLKKRYENEKNIHVISLRENLGFAKGNNIGCKFLRDNYYCDFYIFSNSDILVPENIFSWIAQTFRRTNCDILGPDIYAPKLKTHQNPIKFYSRSPFVVSLKILKKRVELFLLKHNLMKNRILVNTTSAITNRTRSGDIYDHPLHGSFIISGDRYFRYYDSFFDERTFLYMEEYLLFLRCINSDLKMLVSFTNTVVHLQGKSTDKTVVDNRIRSINRIEREIESLCVYRSVLKGGLVSNEN